MAATVDLNPTQVMDQDPIDFQHIKYERLTMLDRLHAESLLYACRVSPDAKRVSRQLATRSLLQSLMTSVPLLATDCATLWALLFVATTIVERLFHWTPSLVTRDLSFVVSLLFAPTARLAGLYPAQGISAAIEFRQLVKSAATSLCIFAGIGFVADFENWPHFVAASLLTLLFTVPILPAARFIARGLASRCSWWGARVLIYAKADRAKELFQRLQIMHDRGLRPAAVLLSAEDYWTDGKLLQEAGIPTFDVRNTLDVAQRYMATWILIVRNDSNRDEPWNDQPENEAEFNAIPNRVLILPGSFDCGLWDQGRATGPFNGMRMSNIRHCGSRASLKRLLDVIVSLVVIVFGSPFLLGLAIAIRMTSTGPIFYSQKRVGRSGSYFAAWKFRTMLPNADQILQQCLDESPEMRREWDETHKLKRDPRVTWAGRFLRPLSLDEFPQLWNILRGDMSLVGPRPIVDSPNYDAAYINDYPSEFAAYSSVRPGLTGLWQVSCRNSGVYEMRIYWDMYYIRNWSLWLDLYIVLRTFRTVLMREGAY